MGPFRFVAFALALCAASGAAQAQEFRLLNRIPTPREAGTGLPPGARVVTPLQPMPAAEIEAAVRDIAAAWNTPALDPLLADNFYDKSRLLGTLASDVPRDAVLRVMAIQGSQTVAQYTLAQPGGPARLYSRVLVTVRTQVEFADPQKGFQRLDGVNELVLRFEGSVQ